MDVSSAFLNGKMDTLVHMRQPPGFEVPGKEHLVCELIRPIYGLKQAPRQWYQKLNDTFKDMGFRRCASDHSVWVWARDGEKIMTPTHVDDFTISGNHTPTLIAAKAELAKRFKIRDLGPVSFLLGMEIYHDREKKRMLLSQRKHVREVLERFNMQNARPVRTPLDKGARLSKDDCPQTDEERSTCPMSPTSLLLGL